jgi:hypothetical protein
MSFFIFLNNLNNIESSLYKIAENQSDLDNLNINKSDYKIIEDSLFNFNQIKYGTKQVSKYSDNTIIYLDSVSLFTKESLSKYITNFKNLIFLFLKNNPNHPLYNKWNDYFNQLSNLNLDSIAYPLNMSLEQYFNEQNQPSLNPLQIP